MRCNEGDYVLVTDPADEKKKLVLVTQAYHKDNGGTKRKMPMLYKGNVSDSDGADGQVTKVSFEGKDVIANFGSNPEPGTAYGTKIEPCFKSIVVRPWGKLYIHRTLADGELEAFIKALTIVGAQFTKLGMTEYLPIQLELRPKRGRYSGYYRYYGSDEKIDVMTLNPHFLSMKLGEEDKEIFGYSPYVIRHEGGHHVWYHHVSDGLKCEWIGLYEESFKHSEASDRLLSRLRVDLVASGMPVNAFRKDLSDEQQEAFDEAMSYVNSMHGLKREHVNLLLGYGNKLEKYWPKRSIELVDTNPFVTDYATVSVEELFAETFAFFLSPKLVGKLPPAARKMILHTFKKCKFKLPKD